MIGLLLAASIAALPGDVVKIEALGMASPPPHRLRLDVTAGTAAPVIVSFRTPPSWAMFSLHQIAGKLVAPVVENQEMTREGDGFRAVLKTPLADTPRRYLLRIQTARADQFFTCDVFAYPSDLPERLRRLAATVSRNGKNISLFGPGTAVRELLGAWKVPFAEAGPDSAVAVGDFIGHDLDGTALPEAGSNHALYLTTAAQADGPDGLVRIQAAEGRKTIIAAGDDWASLAANPAVQYRFVTLLSQTLPTP